MKFWKSARHVFIRNRRYKCIVQFGLCKYQVRFHVFFPFCIVFFSVSISVSVLCPFLFLRQFLNGTRTFLCPIWQLSWQFPRPVPRWRGNVDGMDKSAENLGASPFKINSTFSLLFSLDSPFKLFKKSETLIIPPLPLQNYRPPPPPHAPFWP